MAHSDPNKNIITFGDRLDVRGRVVVTRGWLYKSRVHLKARVNFSDSAEKEASELLSYLAGYVPFSKG